MRESCLSSLLPISIAAATLQALFSKVLPAFITLTTLSILVCWHRISPTGSFFTRSAVPLENSCGWQTSRSVTCAPCREISSVVRRCRRKHLAGISELGVDNKSSTYVISALQLGGRNLRPAFLGILTDCSSRLADGSRNGAYEML